MSGQPPVGAPELINAQPPELNADFGAGEADLNDRSVEMVDIGAAMPMQQPNAPASLAPINNDNVPSMAPDNQVIGPPVGADPLPRSGTVHIDAPGGEDA